MCLCRWWCGWTREGPHRRPEVGHYKEQPVAISIRTSPTPPSRPAWRGQCRGTVRTGCSSTACYMHMVITLALEASASPGRSQTGPFHRCQYPMSSKLVDTRSCGITCNPTCPQSCMCGLSDWQQDSKGRPSWAQDSCTVRVASQGPSGAVEENIQTKRFSLYDLYDFQPCVRAPVGTQSAAPLAVFVTQACYYARRQRCVLFLVFFLSMRVYATSAVGCAEAYELFYYSPWARAGAGAGAWH